MQRFVELYRALDQTQSQNERLAALTAYFREADAHEAAWAVKLLTGGHARRFVSPRQLRQWLADYLQIPVLLVEECYHHVGDLSETVALLLPNRHRPFSGLLPPLPQLAEVELPRLAESPSEEQRQWLHTHWDALSFWESFLLHKLLLGSMRVGVAEGLVIRALSISLEVPEIAIAQKLTAAWHPSPHFLTYLRAGQTLSLEPYPFFLAYPVEDLGENFLDKLGSPSEYQVEWKWDGVRVQVIVRGGQVSLISRGGVCINAGFPELIERFRRLPSGTVLDGELLMVKGGQVLPFAALQKRLLRKRPSTALIAEYPATVWFYDLLEIEGTDIREKPLSERRQLLEELRQRFAQIEVSPILRAETWTEYQAVRANPPYGAEGLMLKRKDSPYLSGRKRGYWWKWKREPYSVDAVLVYAQRGHGRRSGWFTDLTFALWSEEGELITFAKAYSGLTDAEMQELTRWVRQQATEKIGPIVKVPPQWVFEIGFEGIQPSARHKCGYAVRFPRILRWRRDKKPEEADKLSRLAALAAWGEVPIS
ncbi:MAG: ATP-dependent DNA ligase [Bacteroidia bacterium]|nr:ATP-dependent DNA ligase [Bacteroidia bacterium]MDW8234992.1 ATP-dependent DNA ligase [Bacteroidia bacterium]